MGMYHIVGAFNTRGMRYILPGLSTGSEPKHVVSLSGAPCRKIRDLGFRVFRIQGLGSQGVRSEVGFIKMGPEGFRRHASTIKGFQGFLLMLAQLF